MRGVMKFRYRNRVEKSRVIWLGLVWSRREIFTAEVGERDAVFCPPAAGWWFPILRFGSLYPCPRPRTNLNPDTSERTLLSVSARTFSPPRVDRSPPSSLVRRRSSGSTGSARVVSRPSTPGLPVPCSTTPARSSSTFVGGGRSRASLARDSSYKYALRPRTGFIHRDTARTAARGALRACLRACVPACERTDERASEVRASQIGGPRAIPTSICLSVCPSLSPFPLSASPPLVFSLFPSRFYVSRKAKSVAFRAGWCARRLAHPGSYQHGRKECRDSFV